MADLVCVHGPGCDLALPSTPVSIPRDAVLTVVGLLGFDPVDVSSVTLGPDKVEITLFGRDADGRKHVTADWASFASTTVTIPVVG